MDVARQCVSVLAVASLLLGGLLIGDGNIFCVVGAALVMVSAPLVKYSSPLLSSQQTKPKSSCRNQEVAQTGISVSVSFLAGFVFGSWF